MAHVPASSTSYPIRRKLSRHYWTTSLSRDLQNFVVQLLPSPDELAVKEDVRKLLERLIRTIEPDSRLLSFGSTANGFSLRNSDMDLCCLIDSGRPPLNSSDLVTMVGDLLERETKFKVKTLPHARIPIVKLSLDPSPGFPYGIASDIGFENRLALENTRLLMSYASIDPLRVRTLVIFLKVWSKRRKINSPYSGTLSSYGYVLLVIYFLVHVKNPPVLPNLQQMPPLRPISHEETHIGSYNVWFFDDIDLLRQRWQSSNTDSVADLLIDFFKYYSRDFSYNTGVASIRAGLLKKTSKGWQSDDTRDSTRDRNRFCIEDPFEIDYNVARCVTKEGLYAIRGEFMRASRILAARPERTIMALAQLCEERDVEFVRPLPPQPFIPPRLAIAAPQSLHVQTVTQGLDSLPPTIFESLPDNAPDSNPNLVTSVEGLGASINPNSSSSSPVEMALPEPRDPPPHMAPRRAKWTSPPPPDDPDRVAYEDRLGAGLWLATASSAARQPDRGRSGASSSSSEILTDEDHERAELESVGSFVSADGLGPVAAKVGSIHIGQTSSTDTSMNLSVSQSVPKQPLSFFGTPEPFDTGLTQFIRPDSIEQNELPGIEASEDDADGWLVISTPKPGSTSASTSAEVASSGDSIDSTQSTVRGRRPLRFGFVTENTLVPFKPMSQHVRIPDHHHDHMSTSGTGSKSPRRSLSGPPTPRTRAGGRWANFMPQPPPTSSQGVLNKDETSSRTDSVNNVTNDIGGSTKTTTNVDPNSSGSNSDPSSSLSSMAGLNTVHYSSPSSTSSSTRTPFPLYQMVNPICRAAPDIFTSNTSSTTLDTSTAYPITVTSQPTSMIPITNTNTSPDTSLETMSPLASSTMHSVDSKINVPPSSLTTPISVSGTASVPVSDRHRSWPKQGNGHIHTVNSPHHHSSDRRYSNIVPVPISAATQQEYQREDDATPTPKSPKLNGGRISSSSKNTHENLIKDRNITAVQSPSPRTQAIQASQTSAAALEALLPTDGKTETDDYS